MSHGPSTFGSITTSSLLPTVPTISVTSSKNQGELTALTLIQRPGLAEVMDFGHFDEALPRRLFGIDRNRIFEIAKQHVDLADHPPPPGPHLVIVRRKEMDHPLKRERQFTIGIRGADRQRLVEFPGWLLALTAASS